MKLNKQGQISIIILWAMILFIFIALSFAKRASHEVKMVLSTKERVQGHFLIWDTFKTIEKLLKNDERTVDSLQDRWARLKDNYLKEGTTKEGSWEIMKLYDEESLIDINKIGPEVLKTIFGSYPEYYLCLLDWLDEDDIPKQGINIDPQWGGYHGAEKDDPFYEDKEYSPRNKDMHSLYELFLIKGAGDDNGPFPSKESTALKEQKINYFAQIINPVAYAHSGTHQVPIVAPPPLIPWPPGTIPDPNSGENPIRDPSPTGTGFTVYGDGKVNINTAGDTVLGASGFTPATIIRLLTYRFRGNVFKQTGANYIIQQLVNTKCLLTNEQAYSQITSNITNVVSKGKIKVNSDYFRAYIKSETTRGTENTVIMVLKRERVTDPKPETKIKIIAWWENFYLP